MTIGIQARIKAEYFNLADGIYLAAPAELATPTEQNAIKVTVGKIDEGEEKYLLQRGENKNERQQTNKQTS